MKSQNLKTGREKQGFTGMHLVAVSMLAFVLGAVVLYILMLDTPPNPAIRKGPIPIAKAEQLIKKHRTDRLISNWRADSYGVWYEVGEVEGYTKRIKNVVSNLPAPEGYAWKFSVVIGADQKIPIADDRPARSKNGLVAMFLPVLVKHDKSLGYGYRTIDLFEARDFYYAGDRTAKPEWETGSSADYTYYRIYETYYKQFENAVNKKDTCTGCIVFDEGNMFP